MSGIGSRMVRLLLLLSLGAAASLDAAPTFELLAELERPGTQPTARLVYSSADGSFYGTTSEGGVQDYGTVFALTPAGAKSTILSFTGSGGARPGEAPDAGLVLGADGALYGVTLGGGPGGYGTVFRVARDGGNFTTLVSFTGIAGPAKGSVPNELVLSADGNFYGTTQAGGADDAGTLFKLTPAGALTTLLEFTGRTGNSKGTLPAGALVSVPPMLYGVTQAGGSPDLGTVFKFNTSTQTHTLLREFTGTGGPSRGSFPAAGLVAHADGALWGTTESGGKDNAGTIFRITASGTFTLVHEFDDADGANPAGALIVDSSGILYGTTSAGGERGEGTVFKVTSNPPAYVHTVITSLDDDASTPRAALCAGAGGSLFCTASAGGPGSLGAILSVDPAGFYSVITTFSTPQGWQPAGGAHFDANGAFLVPLGEGGGSGEGTVVRGITGGVTPVASFDDDSGAHPAGGMVPFAGGCFGVAREGGAANRGTVFRWDPGAGAQVFASFSLGSGSWPEGPLTRGADGSLYCAAREGGAASKGAITRINPGGTVQALVSFTGIAGAFRGTHPRGLLAVDAGGTFYGVTEAGGAHDKGTVFKVTPAGGFTTLREFDAAGPNTPRGGLVMGVDGACYGTTMYGGTNNLGCVFRIAGDGAFSIVASFAGTTGLRGAYPAGPLCVAIDGTLFGTSTKSGGSGFGTVFRVPPSGAATTVIDFTGYSGGAPGSAPDAELRFGPDGLLYGAAPRGGPRGGGTIFRLAGLGPHVATDEATPEPGKVTLHAHAQTGGAPTSVSFQYGGSADLSGSSTAAGTVTGGPGAIAATFAVPNVATGQTIYYRAIASNSGGTSTGVIRAVTMPQPIAAWAAAYFGGQSFAELGDEDGDGIPNLAEYGLVGNPTVRAAVQPAPILKGYPDGNRLAIWLQRDPARNDVTIQVHAASSPAGPWLTIASSVHGAPFTGPGYYAGDSNSAGMKAVEIRDVAVAVPGAGRCLRIVVIH